MMLFTTADRENSIQTAVNKAANWFESRTEKLWSKWESAVANKEVAYFEMLSGKMAWSVYASILERSNQAQYALEYHLYNAINPAGSIADPDRFGY